MSHSGYLGTKLQQCVSLHYADTLASTQLTHLNVWATAPKQISFGKLFDVAKLMCINCVKENKVRCHFWLTAASWHFYCKVHVYSLYQCFRSLSVSMGMVCNVCTHAVVKGIRIAQLARAAGNGCLYVYQCLYGYFLKAFIKY